MAEGNLSETVLMARLLTRRIMGERRRNVVRAWQPNGKYACSRHFACRAQEMHPHSITIRPDRCHGKICSPSRSRTRCEEVDLRDLRLLVRCFALNSGLRQIIATGPSRPLASGTFAEAAPGYRSPSGCAPETRPPRACSIARAAPAPRKLPCQQRRRARQPNRAA